LKSIVAVTRAEGYDYPALRSSIYGLISTLGGWGRYVSPGERVLIKPNLLSARPPERGVTTHPSVVRAVAESLLDFGATVAVGDSPGGADKGVERVFRNTGMLEVAEKLGIGWVNFESSGTRVIPGDNGITLYITKAIERFDHIVSISKLKTHSLMLYTGAVKNLFGLAPGFRKTAYHKLYPLPTEFGKMLLAIYKHASVTLHFMDAIVGMEGNGPSSGDLRDVGLLLASADGIALDRVASHIIGIEEGRVITTRLADKKGLGNGKLENITVIGGELHDFVLDKPFKLPARLPERIIPSWLVKKLARFIWIRPAPLEEKCTRCGVCAKHCPVDAITMRGEKLPYYDYDKCITCLCCNELCPENAIAFEKSWLAKRLGR